MDIITTVRSKIDSLSNAERKIGKLLVKEPHQFSQMSVRDVASKLSVSEPTVVRFCRNVGCEGYKDLKFKLIQDVAIRQASVDSETPQNSFDYCEPAKPEDADVVEHCFHSAMQALQFVRNSVKRDKVEEAATAVFKATKVPIYGLGGSSSVLALELHNRLFRLGVYSAAYTDSYQQRMSAATLDESDVAIFISSTGRPRALLDSVELAKYYGAKCIGIAPEGSALSKDVDLCLHVELTQSGVYQIQPNPMRFAQLLAVDILALNVALIMGPKAEDYLKRTRASVASLHGIAPQQPIGD